MFGDYTRVTEEGVYVPDVEGFVKVRFPYSGKVRGMVERLLGEGGGVGGCEKEQCLVVRCVGEEV